MKFTDYPYFIPSIPIVTQEVTMDRKSTTFMSLPLGGRVTVVVLASSASETTDPQELKNICYGKQKY